MSLEEKTYINLFCPDNAIWVSKEEYQYFAIKTIVLLLNIMENLYQ